MNKERKVQIQDKQKNIAILKRNKGLLKANILILSAGLSLSYLGKGNIGDPLIWLGVIIFAYTMFTGIVARQQLKARK
ncbi:hypothetical protein SAMN04488589_2836 [Methanolobus vulcani]|uniref:Uncharacterized protein n=1 Tax=Methanolobus vulcani TaxID=38026 RepID=A0A7Z7AZ85_9EURY|nr:hypothetical protein [Methanolobus vulcani]SDG37160.1 hypothetical protein SAMN04488589_2836 [Methanolobus vulcani]